MKEYKIYTCGKMSGIPYNTQMEWRKFMDEQIRSRYDGTDKIKFIHPPLFYNYEYDSHKTEREIIEWEMKQLHDCDIVIVNLENVGSSVGSLMELGAVQGINRFGDKHIFVIGVGDNENIHPWIKETCIRIEKDFMDGVRYIVDYLLT